METETKIATEFSATFSLDSIHLNIYPYIYPYIYPAKSKEMHPLFIHSLMDNSIDPPTISPWTRDPNVPRLFWPNEAEAKQPRTSYGSYGNGGARGGGSPGSPRLEESLVEDI